MCTAKWVKSDGCCLESLFCWSTSSTFRHKDGNGMTTVAVCGALAVLLFFGLGFFLTCRYQILIYVCTKTSLFFHYFFSEFSCVKVSSKTNSAISATSTLRLNYLSLLLKLSPFRHFQIWFPAHGSSTRAGSWISPNCMDQGWLVILSAVWQSI